MALFDEPLALAKDQPHQIAMSTGTVAMMAGFAGSVGIVHPLVGLVIAIGVEWAWLRGMSSSNESTSGWTTTLNISAFILAGLWGVLWCAKLLKAFEPTDYAWPLAVVHVVPVVWLSLCSAMCHQVKTQAEQREQRKLAAEHEQRETERRNEDRHREQALADQQNALHLEVQREQAKLAAWKDAQQFKANLSATQPTKINQKPGVAQPFVAGQMGCKDCGSIVEFSTPSEKGVLARLGCVDCRAKRKAKKEQV
jgi:hypothetical protein